MTSRPQGLSASIWDNQLNFLSKGKCSKMLRKHYSRFFIYAFYTYDIFVHVSIYNRTCLERNQNGEPPQAPESLHILIQNTQ